MTQLKHRPPVETRGNRGLWYFKLDTSLRTQHKAGRTGYKIKLRTKAKVPVQPFDTWNGFVVRILYTNYRKTTTKKHHRLTGMVGCKKVFRMRAHISTTCTQIQHQTYTCFIRSTFLGR